MTRSPLHAALSHRAAGPVAAGLLSFVVYAWTSAPSLTFIDAGELATVACTLGIAHPTGYPLFTLLAHLAALIPLGAPIARLNLFAGVCAAVGVSFFALFLERFLQRVAHPATDFRLVRISAAATALLLGFSGTYWSQGTAIEVYALHGLLVVLILLAFERAFRLDSIGAWLLFAYVLGLSFANHMTTILLAPACLYGFFAVHGTGRAAWKRILLMVPAFVAGLTPYLVLVFRARVQPPMNWGNPATIERLLWHVSGKQYRVWMLSSFDVIRRQLGVFFTTLPDAFTVIGLALAAIGCVALWRLHRRAWIFTGLLIVGCVAYAVNYDIQDIDSYFLLAHLGLALWAGVGCVVVGTYLGKRIYAVVRDVALFLAAGAALLGNYERVNERENHLVEDYTEAMFASFGPGAVVLSYQWDYWVSAAAYVQGVEGRRTDVVVIDKELLRRSWYLEHLEHQFPWLMTASAREVGEFRRELDKFEHDRPYDPRTIEACYARMIRSFIASGIVSRPVYVTREIEPEYTAGFQRVPTGLALRLYPDTLTHESFPPQTHYRPLARRGRLEDQIPVFYAEAFVRRGDYCLLRMADTLQALESYHFAGKFLPGEPAIVDRINRIEGKTPKSRPNQGL